MGVYDSRNLVFVPAKILTAAGADGGTTEEPINYLYLTNVDSSVHENLGIIPVSDPSTLPLKSVFGCNNPKPPRASKKFASGEVRSSFCDIRKIRQLRASGWNISRGNTRPKPIYLSSDSRSRVTTVYVEILGIKRAWNMPDRLRARMGEAVAGLGIQLATQNDVDELIWGCEFPLPPRASAILGSQGSENQDRIETFYKPGNTLPEGWKHSQNGILDLSLLVS